MPDALLAHLAPLGWQHINLTGDYLWDADADVASDGFRPLRSGAPTPAQPPIPACAGRARAPWPASAETIVSEAVAYGELTFAGVLPDAGPAADEAAALIAELRREGWLP